MMGPENVETNTAAYNATVSACENRAMWQHALAVLGMMGNVAVAQNTTGYDAVISACEKVCIWQHAVELRAFCYL